MKVGFPMGLPMVQRLLDANIELVAYNRTPAKFRSSCWSWTQHPMMLFAVASVI